MIRTAVLVVAATAGCAADPGSIFNAPPSAGVHVVTEGSTLTITAGDLALEIPTDNISMPSQLTFDKTPRMSTDDNDSDDFQMHGAGVELYPLYAVAAAAYHGDVDSPTDHVEASLANDATGPVLARTYTTWSIDFACGDAAQHHAGHGVTTFAVFPDGTIVRHDEFTPTADPIIVPGGGMPPTSCGRYQLDEFGMVLRTYWLFVPPTRNFFDATDQMLDPAQGDAGTDKLCSEWTDATVAVQLAGTRTQAVDFGGFAYLWTDEDQLEIDPPAAPLTADTRYRWSKTTGAQACSQTQALLADPPIRFDGTPVPLAPDGTYNDFEPHRSGTTTIQPPADQAMTHGFAVTLDLGATDHLDVERSDGMTDPGWVLVQRDGDATLLWFRDPLPTGASITVSPR